MKLRRLLAAVAVAWALVNVAGMGFAVAAREFPHAGVHLAIAAVLGAAAVWLWRYPGKRAPVREVRVDMLENEVSELQRQLSEAQQGRDFAEQLLADRAKTREADPLRYAPRQTDAQAPLPDNSENNDPKP